MSDSPSNERAAGDLRSTLTEAIDLAEWDWLKPHVARDAVIVVTPDLPLEEVGTALADNNTAVVQRWIDEQAIAKPSQENLINWDRAGNVTFNALIVAPFVLVKLRNA
ncbi:MAG: DUF2288 domain-containing protein [Oscillatoriales cyanobacterium]|nr:MAG: DUF2288 domain-containing protein [Oscillatoriales cyanobacterium]